MKNWKRSLALVMSCFLMLQNCGVAFAKELQPEVSSDVVAIGNQESGEALAVSDYDEETKGECQTDVNDVSEDTKSDNIDDKTEGSKDEGDGDNSDDLNNQDKEDDAEDIKTEDEELQTFDSPVPENTGELVYTYETNATGETYAVVSKYTGKIYTLEVPMYKDDFKVIRIAAEVFKGNEDLVSVKLDGTEIDTIGTKAFEGCKNLETIELPDSLTTLGANAFKDCVKLQSVVIPQNTYVEASAATAPFAGCSSLKSVTFSEGIVTIPAYMFTGCSAVEKVVLPETVRYIGSYAFAGCTSLQAVVPQGDENQTGLILSDNINAIGSCAFEGDVSLKSVRIPNSLTTTSINAYAPFRGTGIITAEFDAGVETLPCNILAGCTELTTVSSSDNFAKLTEIEAGAFAGCSKLDKFNKNEVANVNLPSTVTSIGDSAFEGTAISAITLPEDFKALGKSAFKNCTSLSKINIPKGMSISIGNDGLGPFAGCSSLKQTDAANNPSIIFDNGISSIQPYLFAGCTGFDRYVVPETITSIGNKAFYKCGELKEVLFTNKTTSLGANAFAECAKLEKVNLTNKLTTTAQTVETAPFYKCSKLETIDYVSGTEAADKLTTIPSYMFAGIDGLKKLENLPNTVTKIGVSAYSGCKNLTEAHFPNSVQTVETGAFAGCGTEDDPLVMYGASGSNVEKYAQVNEIKFVAFNYVTKIKVVKKGGTEEISQVNLVMDDSEVELTITALPAKATTKNLTYTIKDDSIVSITETATGVKVKPKKIGATTLSIETNDNSGVKAEIKLAVDPIGKNDQFYVTLEGPKKAVPCGETAKIIVHDKNRKVIPAKYFEYTVDNPSLAKVDKNGLVTAVYPNSGTKTAKIKVSLKNDSNKNRTKTVSVNVVATPIQAIDISLLIGEEKQSESITREEYKYLKDTANGITSITVNKTRLEENTMGFRVVATPFDEMGHETATTDFIWAASDKNIISIFPDGKKCGVLIAEKVTGAVSLTCTAKDTNKVVGAFYFYINDTKPRLLSRTVTLDKGRDITAGCIGVIEAYGNALKTNVYSADPKFKAEYSPQTGIKIETNPDNQPKNGTYNVNFTLYSETDDIPYTFAIKVIVKETKPTLKIVQTQKFNLFYKDSQAVFEISSNGNEVESVQLKSVSNEKTNWTFKAVAPASVDDKGVAKLSVGFRNQTDPTQYYVNNAPVKKITVLIKLKGFKGNFERDLTVATVNTKPTITGSRAATTFFTKDPSNAPYTSTAIMYRINTPGEAPRYVDASQLNFVVNGTTNSQGFVNKVSSSGNSIAFTPILKSGGNKVFSRNNTNSAIVKFEVKEDNWMSAIPVSHTFTINATGATPDINAVVKFNNVVNPTVSLNSRETFDQAILPATISVMGYEFASVSNNDIIVSGYNENLFNVTLDKDNMKLAVSIKEDKRETIAAGNYKVVLATKVKTSEGKDVIVKNNTINITVKKPALQANTTTSMVATVTQIGKFDAIRRNTGISYTLTGITNVNATGTQVDNISLGGRDADLFEIKSKTLNANNKWVVLVVPKADKDFTVYTQNNPKTYEYSIDYKVARKMTDGSTDSSVSTVVSKKYTGIKMTQSAITATVTNTSIYQANHGNNGKFVVKLSSPTDAKIKYRESDGYVYLTPNTIPAEVKRALAFGAVTMNSDGTANINYTMKNPAAMKAGTTYTLYYDVTPVGNGSNIKPTRIAFNITVNP